MERYWRNLVDALVAPVETFRRVRDEPTALFGLLVAVVAQTALTLGTGSFTAVSPVDLDTNINPAADVVGTFIGFLVGVVLIHASARILGGQESLAACMSGLGLAMAPGLLFAPIYILSSLLGVGALAMVGSVLIGGWGLVLDVLAIREVYQFSTARSIGTFLVALIMLAFVAVGVVALVGLVAVLVSL